MKKVFAFVGSSDRMNSNTVKLTTMMLDRLRELDAEIEYEILAGGAVKLNFCQGCFECLRKGACPLDRLDDMPMLKEKMLAADFIVFGTPVYALNMTGRMKTFIDRLCAWYQTFRLAGKAGATVVTAGQTGIERVHRMLAEVMNGLGVPVVATLDACGGGGGTLADPVKAATDADAAAEKALPYVTGLKRPESDEQMEAAFKGVRERASQLKAWLPAAYRYWEESGMLKMATYAEVLEALKSRQAAG